MRRQRERSLTVAWVSRGNQRSGTEIVRPSDKSTVTVSLVTRTWVARTAAPLAVEELIPCLQEMKLMLLDKRLNTFEFFAIESPMALQPNWIKPEFRLIVIALNVDVRRLAAITRVKEKPVRPGSQYRRHCWIVPGYSILSKRHRRW